MEETTLAEAEYSDFSQQEKSNFDKGFWNKTGIPNPKNVTMAKYMESTPGIDDLHTKTVKDKLFKW